MNNGVNNSINQTQQATSIVYQTPPPQVIAPQQQKTPQAPPPPPTKQEEKKKKKKKKNTLAKFLFLIIIVLSAYIYYSSYKHKQEIEKLNYECTPVSTTKGEKDLDLDSTIVQDLYSKVSTNIREDLASTTLDDNMKLYLAYRQISTKKIYDSNCNLFSDTAMEPYICIENSSFSPRAFKEETLQIEVKKLFGEKTNIQNANIQLGKNCLGGYQYIAGRREYVEGYCQNEATTQFSVTKELVKATSNQSTITLKEEVKYSGTESLNVPSQLRSGTYVYTFKLDTNYNYIYVSKTFEE